MVYLDNAASTPVLAEALAAMTEAARVHVANPSSAHALGAAAARALEEARRQVAALLRVSAEEIVLTSGGTEANALGLLGAAAAARGRHALVSGIEHPAVLRNAERLREAGWEVATIAPEPNGVVPAARFTAALRPDTALVALMLVNNELGTVQPVAELAAALRAAGVRAHLHVDAVQAAAWLPISAPTLAADSLAISSHKLHGPKGAGALWLRAGARVAPLWDGGRQERGLRSGTEALPAIAGFGRAAAICSADRDEAAARVATLRDRLEAELLAISSSSAVTVRPTVLAAARAPHVTSVTVAGLPAEPLLHALAARGVFASAGSACASRARGPSHVLRAIGSAERDAVLRFSLSRLTTEREIEMAAGAFAEAVAEIAAVPGRRGRGGRR